MGGAYPVPKNLPPKRFFSYNDHDRLPKERASVTNSSPNKSGNQGQEAEKIHVLDYSSPVTLNLASFSLGFMCLQNRIFLAS